MDSSEDILHNLKIVAKVSEQDKLVTGPRYGLRNPTLTRSLSRWWNGENRQRDFESLRGLFSAAVNLVIVGSDARHLHALNVDRLVAQVRQAVDGLRVLVRTYHDDHDMCARLDHLIEETIYRLDRVVAPSLTVMPSPASSSPTLPPASPPPHPPPASPL